MPHSNIPVLPLRSTVLFPGQLISVVVGRKRSLAALEAASKNEGWLLVVAQKENIDEPKIENIYHTGTLARIESDVPSDHNHSHRLELKCIVRFRTAQIDDNTNYLQATGSPSEDIQDLSGETAESLMQNMKVLAREIFSYLSPALSQLFSFLDRINDPSQLASVLVQHLDIEVSRKQELLEIVSVKDRFLILLETMVKIRDELKIQNEVQKKVSKKLGKQQREVLLREQIEALQEELGEGRDELSKDYLEKIEQRGMPEEVKKVALEQLSRLGAIPSSSPEMHVIRNYLDLLVELPWSQAADEQIELNPAREILERDHFGLEKIKTRIIQHLAVMKLKKHKKGSILLFVGPPGVGKTSLARSIAEALGRQYVRISLGGVRDDAEIRGHRRTYVGAMPGRIIDGIKRAGENNPVFVLDEVDKLSRSFGGDPASAMLEVLDPEQNTNFLDHYLDVPFDLSNVFFIATANTLDTIPPPLRDRMEVVELSGYTCQEKFHIARRHLVPKQVDEHGLVTSQVEVTNEALHHLINNYTREAGVRELQRNIGALMRYAAERIVSGEEEKLVLDLESVEKSLGPPKFILEKAARDPAPGVVTGLAWTPMGGDILFVESRIMPGKGELTLTGQLGEVMKESAQIAFSHIRSREKSLHPRVQLDRSDIHLHVPAGSIPKDGPSAGITMLISLASLIMGRAVPTDLAMTGEINLRGTIMPVGGVKEKAIAAHRSGLKKIILPKPNERDLVEIPPEVKEELEFRFVETVDEVFHDAFGFHPVDRPSPIMDLTNEQDIPEVAGI